jgi:hypothetical protein
MAMYDPEIFISEVLEKLVFVIGESIPASVVCLKDTIPLPITPFRVPPYVIKKALANAAVEISNCVKGGPAICAFPTEVPLDNKVIYIVNKTRSPILT